MFTEHLPKAWCQALWLQQYIQQTRSLRRWKRKLQYFGHLMQRADSLEKILMLGKTEGRRRRGNRG